MAEEFIKKLVIALGGNAILQYGQSGTVEEQKSNLKITAKRLAPIIASWFQVVVTHGNGPQVGNILIQNERSKDEVPAMPLDICGAQSQGQIGYLLQQVLWNELASMGKRAEVTTILTQTLVNGNDPAFKNPSKPVGLWLTEQEMLQATKEHVHWINDPKKGWRRVVPSPKPVHIVNAKSIESALKNGFIVLACGGGGVPVVKEGSDRLRGINGVVDKDLASECLASDIRAHILLMLTDVPAVFLDFNSQDQKPIERIKAGPMRELLESGIFPEGSIGPKVEAAIQFVEKGGDRAIIADIDHAEKALKGRSGTIILGEE